MIVVIVILIILGIAAVVSSFFINVKKEDEKTANTGEYLDQMFEERINQVEHRLDHAAEKSATSIQKQAKREIEKLSKEKLSQVNEYSDQVMDQINKNHNEVMFLYGLLSDKQKQLDETVEKLDRAQKELQVSQMLNRQEERNFKWGEEPNINSENENSNDKKNITIENSVVDAQDSMNKNMENMFSASYNEKEAQKDVNELEGSYGRRAQILMLSKEGKTDFEIARQLEMGVGEVRLVLELSKGV